MNADYIALIESNRVSSQTREVLQVRGSTDDPLYRSSNLTPDQYATLHALATRIIPQEPSATSLGIDLAACLDRQLASGEGDGWRFAKLPPDLQAFSIALTLLDESAGRLNHASFRELSSSTQDAMLTAIADGEMNTETFDLQRWFEDLRAAFTGIYVSQPDTLARMHYSGIADDPNGFTHIGIGQIEAWEPR